MRARTLVCCVGVLAFGLRPVAVAGTAAVEYLGDVPERILSHSQSWGELGLNTAAYDPSVRRNKAGDPLRIGDQQFAKGLGHHANGALVVLLDGEFSWFDAEVGLQPCGVGGGSVVFRVSVDGEMRFDSGILRTADGAKTVHVNVEGAQELRLDAGDAGDGITCDMANWGNARLTRSDVTTTARPPAVDMARFARVVTWDPDRKDGCRTNRLQEFAKEDLFLETDLVRQADGSYTIPRNASGQGCIGLQWLNRRALRELRLRLSNPVLPSAVGDIRVEGWFGESAWQGQWKPLSGDIVAEGNDVICRLSPRSPEGDYLLTRKVRWILPPVAASWRVRELIAFTRTRWDTARLLVQAESASAQAPVGIAVHNGESLTEITPEVTLSTPLHLEVRFARPSSLNADRTVIQFRLPTGAFGVAVEDVLANECVYLPDHGLFVTRDPAPISPADYRRKVAARRTILEEVRVRPDQTLAQAMARTHNPLQCEGPVMLSLACDNTKYLLERDGILRFHAAAGEGGDWFASAGRMQLRWGSGQADRRTRQLDGGWLPIPVITTERDGIVCTQRVFVAPVDDPGSNPARLNRRAVCVAEFTWENLREDANPVSAGLDIMLDNRGERRAGLTSIEGGFRLEAEGGVLGSVVVTPSNALKLHVLDGRLQLGGTLPPGGTAGFVAILQPPAGDLPILPAVSALRRDVESYWQAVLSPAMQIETPDSFINDLVRSSQVRCLIAARNEADGARVAPWIAAMAYGPFESEAHSVIRGMDFLGHGEFARRGLEFFIHRYNAYGFLTTGYTTFGTAWHLWTLAQHCQLTGDRAWLQTHASEVARVGDWIVRQLAKTRTLDSRGQRVPEYGLMPPGVMADWNAFACHFCMNAYYYAALRDLGAVLGDIGHPRAAVFQEQAVELRNCLITAYRWTQAQSPALPLRNGTWIPHYPSQVHSPGLLADFFPGQDFGRTWAYDVELGAHQLVPAGVFDPNDPEVTRMMDHMEDVHFLGDGWFDYPADRNRQDWFHLGGFSKVQPYYTRNAEVYALRDDVKPFLRTYFNSIASLVNPEVMTFWEHFRHSGAWDKTHETGYFLYQTRQMLVMERGRTLWLAPLIPTEWLQHGRELIASNCPTRFGPVSYRISSQVDAGRIEVAVTAPRRDRPEAIVIRLRHPEGRRLDRVEVNGRPHDRFDADQEIITLASDRDALTVIAYYR